jgi:hypothetical protein
MIFRHCDDESNLVQRKPFKLDRSRANYRAKIHHTVNQVVKDVLARCGASSIFTDQEGYARVCPPKRPDLCGQVSLQGRRSTGNRDNAGASRAEVFRRRREPIRSRQYCLRMFEQTKTVRG